MMDPDLAQLRALAAVVDEGSFDAAAVALHLTPSAVSQRIKALEIAAGRVLVRRTKPAAVTEAGEAYLRLARQVDALVHAAQQEAGADDRSVTIPLAVNADSLATWVLPALAPLAGRAALDLHREDQAHTAALLRAGTVMAAVTGDAAPVQGCRVTRLGAMRYRPMASPEIARRLTDGLRGFLASTPVVVFDRKDEIQDAFLRRRAPEAAPPRHHVPSSADFLSAVLLGWGWGMLPDLQTGEHEAQGRLVDLEPDGHVDVDLYWQQWSVRTPVLDAVADAVVGAAREVLNP